MTPEMTTSLREEIRAEFKRFENLEHPADFPALPPVPAGRYADQAFWELEQQHLWPKIWLIAGHVDEIPEKGSFKRWDEAGIPTIIVRGRDGVIRAFENACRHRGGALVYENSGKLTALSCKYHGWTYDLTGSLRFVPDEHEFPGLDKSQFPLRELRCELWGNFIFVNRDPQAIPLLEWLGPIAIEFEDFSLENRHVYAKVTYDLDCNWKVAIDSNAEAYHVIAIHPDTVHKMLDYRGNVIHLYRNGHSRLLTPYRVGPDGEAFELLDINGPGTDENHALTREAIRNYVLFPNFMISAGEFQFPFITYWPNGINKTKMVVYYTTPFANDDPESQACRDVVAGFDVALEEDRAPLEAVQRSYMNHSVDALYFSYAERRLYHHAEEVDRVIGVENIPERYRVVPITHRHTADPYAAVTLPA